VTDTVPDIELSKREQEVLELVVTGASNKEIAQQLVISVNTVKVHIRNIFEKLNVQSRTEATRLALQEKLVSGAPEESSVSDAEDSSSRTRSFLINTRNSAALQAWQQYYLLGALLLATLIVIVPLVPRKTPKSIPNLPVIYTQPSTPTPPPQNGTDPNRWTTHATMPSKRAGLAVVALDREIFAIGGVRDNNKATRLVEIYDTVTDSWIEGATKPTATTNIAAAALDGRILVPGGCTNDGQALDILEIYDPTNDSWIEGEPMPGPRCGYGLAVVENTLYLFGGWNGEAFENTIFTYKTGDKGWESLDQTLASPVGFVGTGVLNNIIYLVGGYDGNQEYDTTFAFDPTSHQLTEKAKLHEKRGGPGVVAGGRNLYAVGGGWDHVSTSSEKYNPATDIWTVIETPFTGQWRNLGLVTVDTSIYAIGGWNGDEETYMDEVVSYQFIYQLFLPISSGDEDN
jgi:DNA-binding CsgD family transcriptional regulator/N-acetylneuraminic acid mutarotase